MSGSDKFFTYKSPTVKDVEKDAPIFKFFSQFPCKCADIKENADHFVLSIDKTKLTEADNGPKVVSIQLKDKWYADSKVMTVASLKVNINFIVKPEEVKEETSNTTESASNSTEEAASNSTASDDAVKEETAKKEEEPKKEEAVATAAVKEEETTEKAAVVEEKPEEEEVEPEKPKETPTESALVQEKGEPKIDVVGPATADWQTEVDPEEMRRQIAESARKAKALADAAKKRWAAKQAKLMRKKFKGKVFVPPPPPPVKLKISKISAGGDVNIDFNQKL